MHSTFRSVICAAILSSPKRDDITRLFYNNKHPILDFGAMAKWNGISTTTADDADVEAMKLPWLVKDTWLSCKNS